MRRSNQLKAKCQVLKELDSLLARRGIRCDGLAAASGPVPAVPPIQR